MISSRYTFMYKYLLPLGWLFFCGYLVYIGFFDTGEPPRQKGFAWFALIFWVMSLLIFCFSNFPLKAVKADDQFLYLSNYFKQIKTPLSNIMGVNKLGIGTRLIKITLKSPTEFGKEILLLPKMDFKFDPLGLGFDVPAAIRELKESVNHSQKR